MAYRPPTLRKQKTQEEVIADAVETVRLSSDTHFPTLGNSSLVSSTHSLSSSYASKAAEWKARKEEIEMNERIDAELKIQKAERDRKRQEEEEYIKSTLIQPVREKPVIKVTYVEPPKVEEEWTLVQRKPRKERKPKFEEPEEDDGSDLPLDDSNYADKDSIW